MKITSESTTTTTRRRAGPGIATSGAISSNSGDDTSTTELELSRWSLVPNNDNNETEPLAATTGDQSDGAGNDDDDDEESDNNRNNRDDNAPLTVKSDNNRNNRDDNAPLTVKLTDYIDPEQEEEYLTWQKGISNAMEETVDQDNVGSIILREMLHDGRIRFVVLFRFRNRESAEIWHASTIRREWLQKLSNAGFHKSFIEDPGHFTTSDSSYNPVPIFDVTQPIPDDVSFTAQPRPQRWRTAFLVWIQVYVLVEFYGFAIPRILGYSNWANVHFHLQLIISTAITTFTIEAFTMQLFVKAARIIGFLKSV